MYAKAPSQLLHPTINQLQGSLRSNPRFFIKSPARINLPHACINPPPHPPPPEKNMQKPRDGGAKAANPVSASGVGAQTCRPGVLPWGGGAPPLVHGGGEGHRRSPVIPDLRLAWLSGISPSSLGCSRPDEPLSPPLVASSQRPPPGGGGYGCVCWGGGVDAWTKKSL